jgi:thioredoxin reductase (NADPH)
MDAILLEGTFPGGQAATTSIIENYPGFEDGISGPELTQRMLGQAKRLGLEVKYGTVQSLDLEGDVKTATISKSTIQARAVILSMGAAPKTLNVKGESEFRGRGVSYCATCDGMFFKGKDVAVVGGGDTAAHDALYLSALANSVHLIHRRDRLRAAQLTSEHILSNNKIYIHWNSQIDEIVGDKIVTGVRLHETESGETILLPVAGALIAVGVTPLGSLVQGRLPQDESGYVLAGEDCRTSISGVYVAGDLRRKPLRQVVTAASDGATAVTSAIIDFQSAGL